MKQYLQDWRNVSPIMVNKLLCVDFVNMRVTTTCSTFMKMYCIIILILLVISFTLWSILILRNLKISHNYWLILLFLVECDQFTLSHSAGGKLINI